MTLTRRCPVGHARRAISLALALTLAPAGARGAEPRGDAVIRAPAGGSEIVITTTSRLAGAVHSLTWGGREFIDSADHGRQLQSAVNLDAGRPLRNEAFNPTEAGSRRDGAGPTSSSRLIALRAGGNRLETTTQMAFWLAPGERSEGNPASNTTVLSDHLLTKRVTIGRPGLPHAIDYDVTFTVPPGEPHTRATFEAVTGYMPRDFGAFYGLDVATARVTPLTDGPGEQPRPVVLATADGSHAMGVVAVGPPEGPGDAPGAWSGPGYGRFRFRAERVVKWNAVFRLHAPGGVTPGRYRFRLVVAVGTLDDVRRTLAAVAPGR